MEKPMTYTVKKRLNAFFQSCVLVAVGLLATVSVATAQCSPPTGFSFTDVTGSAVTLNWTASPSAVVSYEVNTRDSLSSTWVTASTTISGSATTYRIGKDVALSPNKTYQVRIRANCSGTKSAYVSAGYVRTTSAPTCGLPFNLSATDVSSVGVTFKWESSTANLTSYEARYRVVGGSWYSTGILPAQTVYSKRMTNLSPGKTYEWLVNGICSNGDRITVSGANFVTPTENACSAPTNLSVDRLTNVGANFNWNATVGTGSFRIYAKSSSATSWTLVGSPSGSDTTYRFYDFIPNTTYSWYMQSVCSNGDRPADKYTGPDFSTNSIEYCASPTSPSAIAIADTGATLNWVADTSAGSNIKYFEFEVFKIGSPNVRLTTQFKKVLSYRLSNLLPNTQYSWRLKTHCTNSDRQPWVLGGVFTTNCQSPTVFSTSDITGKGATLNWNFVPAKGYTVRIKQDTASAWTYYSVASTDSSLRVSNLKLSSNYIWQVQDTCLSGNVNPWRNGGTFTTLATPYCAAPSGLTVNNVLANSATFAWASTSLVGEYTLAVRNNSSSLNGWMAINVSGGLSTYTVTFLSSGTTYEWRMKNVCTNGDQNNDWVYGTNFTTVCASPSGLDTSSVTGTGATLNWAIDNTNVSKFEVQIKTVAAATWTNVSTNLAKTALNIRVSTLSPSTSYVWRIRSTCSNNTVNNWMQSSGFTTKATFACGQPTSLATADITSNGADLTWVGGTSIATFDIEYKTSAAVTWTRISNISSSTTSRRLTTLSQLTTYMWRIRSICSNGDVSPWVDGANFTTTAEVACQSPTSLNTSSLTANGATLNWSLDTVGLSSVQISYKTSAGTTWGTAVTLAKGATSYRLSTLAANTSYDWRVRTVCSNGDVQAYVTGSSFSTTSVAACHSATDLFVSDTTSNGATLNWSTDTTGLRSIHVSYKTSAATTWGTTVVLAKGITSYRLSALSAVTSYVWRIRTVCGNNDVTDWVVSSNFSTTAEAACQSPTSLNTTSLTSVGATLNWSLDTVGLKNIQVSYKLSSSATWGTAVTLAKGTTSYRLSTLTANTSYDWRIRTVCSNNDVQNFVTSSFSTTNTNACNSPTSLNATSITSTGVTLGWSIDTVGLKSMQLYYKLSSATTWSSVIAITKGTTSYRLSALTANTAYDWRIRSICSNNDVQNFVTSSFSTTNATACNSPASLTATNITNVGVTLGWSIDTVGLKSMQLYYKLSSTTTWSSLVTIAKGVSSYRLNGLAANTSYDWRIRSICSNNDVQNFVTSSFSTTNTTACNSPSSLTATSLSAVGATLGWTLDTIGLKNIQVSYKLTSSSTWGTAVTLAKATTSYRLNALNANTSYDWRVRTVCSNGDVQAYVTSSFMTTDTYACSQPSSLFTSNITTSAVKFNWTGGTAISSYDIQFKTVAATTWSNAVLNLSSASVSYTRTGLTSGTTYMWRMRSKCTNTDINPWVDGANFTTLAARLGDESFVNNWTETITMFPNPSGGLVNVGIETANELPIEITVLNALGQQVVSRNVTFTNDNNTTEFNLAALPAGMYFVKMKSAQKVVTRQLILENR